MLKVWKRGKEQTLAAGKYGKKMKSVMFQNPKSRKWEEYTLFGQKDWSIILPVTKDGLVATVLQYKQGCDKIIQELPAGTFTVETPAEVAERELLKETGFQAEEMLFLGPPLWMTSRNSWTRFWPFLATGCQKTKEVALDVSEEIETKIVSLKEWIEMTRTTIEEPSAIVTTFRALPHIKHLL